MSQNPNQPPPGEPQGSGHSGWQAPVPPPLPGAQPPPAAQPGQEQPSGAQAPQQRPPAPQPPSGGHPGHGQRYGQQAYQPQQAPPQHYGQPSGAQQGHRHQGPPEFAPPVQPTFEQPAPQQGYRPQAPQQPYGAPQPVYGQPGVQPGRPAQGDGGDVLVAMSAHLTGFMIAFLGWIPPLAIYFAKRDKSQFIRHHSSEAANFQLTLLIPYVFAVVLFVGLGIFFGNLAWIGSLFIALTWIVSIALGVLGASGANKGAWHRYPISIRLLK